jgi:hypothetical protein
MKEKNDFEIFCYENESGQICLEFGEAAVSFTKKRFLEFADKLNQVRQSVMHELLLQKTEEKNRVVSYRI